MLLILFIHFDSNLSALRGSTSHNIESTGQHGYGFFSGCGLANQQPDHIINADFTNHAGLAVGQMHLSDT